LIREALRINPVELVVKALRDLFGIEIKEKEINLGMNKAI
jgi:hypothetical protein